MIKLQQGDCREVLATMEASSVDACVTDPPYHLGSMVKRLSRTNAADVAKNFSKTVEGQARSPYAALAVGFMGKTWDGGDVAMRPETWADVARVLKPGAHLAAFGGTRTFHRVAVAIEDAGCFMLEFEAVPAKIAKLISEQLTIPTIGIGASASCDGQVLVVDDMLGMFERGPRFVKKYANLRETIATAAAAYADEVRSGAFPTEAHCYGTTKKTTA